MGHYFESDPPVMHVQITLIDGGLVLPHVYTTVLQMERAQLQYCGTGQQSAEVRASRRR